MTININGEWGGNQNYAKYKQKIYIIKIIICCAIMDWYSNKIDSDKIFLFYKENSNGPDPRPCRAESSLHQTRFHLLQLPHLPPERRFLLRIRLDPLRSAEPSRWASPGFQGKECQQGNSERVENRGKICGRVYPPRGCQVGRDQQDRYPLLLQLRQWRQRLRQFCGCRWEAVHLYAVRVLLRKQGDPMFRPARPQSQDEASCYFSLGLEEGSIKRNSISGGWAQRRGVHQKQSVFQLGRCGIISAGEGGQDDNIPRNQTSADLPLLFHRRMLPLAQIGLGLEIQGTFFVTKNIPMSLFSIESLY